MEKTLRPVLQLSPIFYIFVFSQTLFVLGQDLKQYTFKLKVSILLLSVEVKTVYLESALYPKEAILIFTFLVYLLKSPVVKDKNIIFLHSSNNIEECDGNDVKINWLSTI